MERGLVWFLLVVLTGVGIWRHVVMTDEIAMISSKIDAEVANRKNSESELMKRIDAVKKENQENSTRLTSTLHEVEKKANDGTNLATKNRKVLEFVYDIHESKSGVVVVSPKSDDNPISIGK